MAIYRPPQDELFIEPYPSSNVGSDIFGYYIRLVQDSLVSFDAGTQEDSQILAPLADAVLSLLASIPHIRPVPRVVEAVFVPDDALGPEWTLSDPGDQEKGGVSRIVRVRQEERREEKPISRGSAGGDEVGLRDVVNEFNDWGRWDDDSEHLDSPKSLLWWSNADQAHRLACHHLRPIISRSGTGVDDSLVMVKVEEDELAFRRANEMGLWESKRGWCIVVTISLRR